MSKPLEVIVVFGSAAAAALLAPVLTFFLGWYSCRLLAWVTGDEQYMGGMLLVWPLVILAIPAGFLITGFALDRLLKRRAQRSHGVDASPGFPVERRS